MRRHSIFLSLSLSWLIPSAGCSESGNDPGSPMKDCSTLTLTYENFGEQFFETYCNSCHSASATSRFGAPIDENYDTLSDIQRQQDRIRARAADGTSMPPQRDSLPIPTAQERDDLRLWLDCVSEPL